METWAPIAITLLILGYAAMVIWKNLALGGVL